MQLEDMIMVSVDDHLVEPPSMSDYFADHFPAKYRDRVPRVIHRDDGTDAWLVEGHEVSSFGLNAVAGRVPEEWGNDPGCFEEVRKGTWDVHERIRDMNANGVLGSMCFSSWPGLGGSVLPAERRPGAGQRMIRAYNDWHVEEWAGAYPGRFIPLSLSGFILGPEWMAERDPAHGRQGLPRGVVPFDTHRFGLPDHHGDEWYPAWQACRTPTLSWSSTSEALRQFMPRSPFDIMIHTMPFNTGVFASELLWSPVLRKFPDGEIRAGRGRHRMDALLARAGRLHVPTSPSPGRARTSATSFRARSARVGCSACFIDDYTGLRNAYDIGVENIAWECDYPHSDCTWPHGARGGLEVAAGGPVPDDEIDKITWENACRFYSFDPLAHRTREECTVGALRAEAVDVDITPKSYGMPDRSSPPVAALPS